MSRWCERSSSSVGVPLFARYSGLAKRRMCTLISRRRTRSACEGSFHADRDIGLAHRQVEDPLLEHQVDLEVGKLVVELRQAGARARASRSRSWL